MDGQLPPAKVLPMPVIEGFETGVEVETPSDEIGGNSMTAVEVAPPIIGTATPISPPPNVIGAPASENSAQRYAGHR